MFCAKCGKEIAGNPSFCPNCGNHLGYGQAGSKPKLAGIAGILDIAGGVIGLLVSLGLLVFISLISLDADFPFGLFFLPVFFVPAGGGVLAIVGGIYALRRKNWGLAMAGAIGAAVGVTILGVAALVLTALARDEFEK